MQLYGDVFPHLHMIMAGKLQHIIQSSQGIMTLDGMVNCFAANF